MAEALPLASTTRRGVNPSKFMGASFAAGSNLSDTVFNNSRKITQITSILKLRKENVDKNLKGEDINNENLAERLNNIAQTLAVLTRALKQQLITQKRSADVNKQNINEQKKKNREKDLEKQKEKKSGGGGAGRVMNAIKAPFTGIFGAAKNFFSNIVAGSAVLGLMKWLKEMEDSKWQSMIKTLQDNAGLVLAGILAVAAIPVLATVATFTLALVGAVAIFGPMIVVIGKALFWITKAVAIIAALWAAAKLAKKGATAVSNWTHDRWSGGQASGQIERFHKAEMEKVGVKERDIFGLASRFNKFAVKDATTATGWRGVDYEDLNKEQKAVVDKWREDRKRMNALEKERDKAVASINKEMSNLSKDPKFSTGTSVKNRKLNEAGIKKKNELELKKKVVINKYENLIRSGSSLSSANIGDMNVTPPKIDQPLGGEGSVNFLPLGDTSSEGGASSSVEGGNNVPSFSSSSGKVGNQFVVGAWNA